MEQTWPMSLWSPLPRLQRYRSVSSDCEEPEGGLRISCPTQSGGERVPRSSEPCARATSLPRCVTSRRRLSAASSLLRLLPSTAPPASWERLLLVPFGPGSHAKLILGWAQAPHHLVTWSLSHRDRWGRGYLNI